MDADIKGCLKQLDRSWKAFEHKGNKMTKEQVKKVLEYGVSVSQLSDDEVDRIINSK